MNLPKKIVSKRLILRLMNRDDFEVFSDILKDATADNNLKFILKMKLDNNSQQIFNSIIDSYNSINPVIVLIVINKESGNYIGLCGLLSSENGKKAQCFYLVRPEYRGHGFAIEAMKKLIEYAFEEPTLTGIIAFIRSTNSRAWKVAERVGMKYMGHVSIKDISSKTMYFSIERAEFEAQGEY